MENIRFKRVLHVGVVVDDLAQAESFLLRAFGLEVQRRTRIGAFLSAGNIDIELIYPKDPEERGRFLDAERTAVIDHLAVEVGDLDEARAHLEQNGVAFETDEPIRIGQSLMLYTRADTSDGVRYQLIQNDPDDRRNRG